jgi:hypothetical protein
MNNIFKYIKGAAFFPKYAPSVIDWKRKMSGKNSNGNDLDFSESDKLLIKKGLIKMFKEILF